MWVDPYIVRGFSNYIKFSTIGIVVLLKIENKGEIDTSSIIFNSAFLHKCNFVLDFILLTIISDLYRNTNDTNFVYFQKHRILRYLPVNLVESDFRCRPPRRYLCTLTFSTSSGD